MNIGEKTIKDIMSTEGYICITSKDIPVTEINSDLEFCEKELKLFESNFSRFKKDNQLWEFNNTYGSISLSDEMLEMLDIAIKYWVFTNKVFDISILPYLLKEGYTKSKSEGFSDDKLIQQNYEKRDLKDLIIDHESKKAIKPIGLTIDLGGIGKGYIIDKISKYLSKKYSDFCVEIGGDLYINGCDNIKNYKYWAIEIEDPKKTDQIIDTLIVSNKGIATSGVNRRTWLHNGIKKNHIIDPKTGKSVDNQIYSVTVVSDTTVFSDIIAKSVLIMGPEKGINFCNENKIAAIIVCEKLEKFVSASMEQYVWKK